MNENEILHPAKEMKTNLIAVCAIQYVDITRLDENNNDKVENHFELMRSNSEIKEAKALIFIL